MPLPVTGSPSDEDLVRMVRNSDRAEFYVETQGAGCCEMCGDIEAVAEEGLLMVGEVMTGYCVRCYYAARGTEGL